MSRARMLAYWANILVPPPEGLPRQAHVGCRPAPGAASVGAAMAAHRRSRPRSCRHRTVTVYATVTNARGRLVPDLSREDFAIDDNGKRQTLTLFANDIQPITLVMLLDRSGSMKPNFELEEQAAEAFVRAMLPADKARIGSFGEPHPDRSARVHVGSRRARRRFSATDLQKDGPTPLLERA